MNEITLDFLLKIFKKTWWKIMIVTIAIMIAAAAVTHFFIPKKYSSSIRCYIVNVNTDYDYTSTSLLGAASYLINDYVSIIKSDYLLNPICEELKAQGYTNITPAAIRKADMISSSIESSQTSVFTITVTHTDKVLAYKLAALLAEKAPAIVTEVAKPDNNTDERLAEKMHTVIKHFDSNTDISQLDIEAYLNTSGLGLSNQLNCFEVLTPPQEAKTHDSPSLVLNTLLAGIAAAVVTYCIYLLRYLLESNITTEDDIKRMIDRPLIGIIPRWETGAKK